MGQLAVRGQRRVRVGAAARPGRQRRPTPGCWSTRSAPRSAPLAAELLDAEPGRRGRHRRPTGAGGPAADALAGMRGSRCPAARGRGRRPGPLERLDRRRRRLGLRHRLRRARPRPRHRAATSTSWCSTPRCTPTPAARPRRRRHAARWPSSPPAGKTTGKKDLGADRHVLRQRLRRPGGDGGQHTQTVKAFAEAEAPAGASLIIAYSPCIAHGIDMATR